MKTNYPHLLSPLKVGNTVFKNRIFSSPMGFHSMQSGEKYPTEEVIASFANKARGGAGCVVMTGTRPAPVTEDDGYHHGWDIYTEHNRKMLCRLSDAVHFYGAKAGMELNCSFKGERDHAPSAGSMIAPNGMEFHFEEMTTEMIEESIASYATHAKKVQECGFDLVTIHMAYQGTMAGRFISPLTNTRTDKYGGSAENRARYIVEVCEAIRKACGPDLVIELRLSARDSNPDGITIDDTLTLLKMVEGKADLVHAHGGVGPDVTFMGCSHVMSFRPDYPMLEGASLLKQGGTSLKIGTIGGYQDPDFAEQVLASGQADYVMMGRGLIADPNTVQKAYENRPEDIVPCIKCMRCHDSACFENRYLCSVNPTIGIEHKLAAMIPAPGSAKKVAVVGGGPSGMEAALVAAKRGHQVTLFEKQDHLGGQLVFADHADFKRNLSRFKNYMAAQVAKTPGIEVRLNTEAVPELLADFDIVFAALGAEPIRPAIPGAEAEGVLNAPAVYGHADAVGQKVVIIGGGEVGCETAYYLAENGKDVTVLEMQDRLAPDASSTYRSELLFYLERNTDVKTVTGARCTGIGRIVTYVDADGTEQHIEANSVVLAVGMKPRQDEALSLYAGNFNTKMIGDCDRLGNLSGAMRTAFSAASQI